MNAGFGVRVALHADGFARAFAGAGVCGSALAADGQAPQMADAAITFDTLEALEIHAQFAAQIAFDDVLAVLNGVNNLGQLLFVQILGANGGVNAGLGKYDFGIGRANAIDVTQSDIDSLSARYFNTNDSCHKCELTLSLFVARVRANDTNHALAFDDLAVFAKLFY
jgi:hypothetical protein